MNLPIINFASILPAIVLSLFGIVIMVADPFLSAEKKHALGWFGFAGILLALLSLGPMSSNRGLWYADIWLVDDYTIFFHVTFLLIAALTTLASLDFLRREQVPPSEFLALVLFATTGMLLMAGAGELMMIFIGLEILSIATYVLAGYRRGDLKSNEAALKYFPARFLRLRVLSLRRGLDLRSGREHEPGRDRVGHPGGYGSDGAGVPVGRNDADRVGL